MRILRKTAGNRNPVERNLIAVAASENMKIHPAVLMIIINAAGLPFWDEFPHQGVIS